MPFGQNVILANRINNTILNAWISCGFSVMYMNKSGGFPQFFLDMNAI
jgi:hypothetical protein